MNALLFIPFIVLEGLLIQNETVHNDLAVLECENKNALSLRPFGKDKVIFDLEVDSLPILYAENAIIITENGDVIEGKNNAYKFKISQGSDFQDVETLALFNANERRGLEYEIRESKSKSNILYKSLIIWKKTDDIREREFEITIESHKNSLDLAVLDMRREEWMKYCNAHDVEGLVKELYSANTMYYNHKPIIRGYEDLIKEYDYMNNEKYSLILEPLIVETVKDDFIFEIGQCKEGYNGKYVLIWKKDADGKWRIFIDSNI